MDDPAANPFASPATDGAQDAIDQPVEPWQEEAVFRRVGWRIIWAWERLRWYYLGWLALVSLAWIAAIAVFNKPGWPNPLTDPDLLPILLVGFVAANLCFTVAHALEIGLAIFGMLEPTRCAVRMLVFILGSLFAAALAVLVIGMAVWEW